MKDEHLLTSAEMDDGGKGGNLQQLTQGSVFKVPFLEQMQRLFIVYSSTVLTCTQTMNHHKTPQI